MTVGRVAGLLLAGACLGGATACDDAGPTSPTPVETMIAPASIVGRTVAGTIRETLTRCTAPPGSVIRYHFEDADTLRAVRADGLFDGPASEWSYTRTGTRSAEIEMRGRTTVGARSSWRFQPTTVERSSSGTSPLPVRSTAGDVTQLHYRGDFEVQLGGVP